MVRTPREQLIHFLSDMYSVEQQALAQMVTAPNLAGDPLLSADFKLHYTETEQQAELVRQRLEAHGGAPSLIKDAIMKLGGKGFLLFARAMPETPGRLVVHSYSYEAMEWAGYEMLSRFAEKAGDSETVEIARTIGAQERAMMQRLERGFDAAERASHVDVQLNDMQTHLIKHLTEVHAFESQSIELLDRSKQIAGGALLGAVYSRHRIQLQEQATRIEACLETLGASTSSLKDSALALGGINWSFFFQAQSDTPAKLAAFVYAVLHLEIGGYELLTRTARRAGDAETGQLCEDLIRQKRMMADELYHAFDAAVEATFAELQDASG